MTWIMGTLQLLEEIRVEYNLYINDPFVVGEYNKTPIVMFGLNPGYSLLYA
jgi:hypothetical protein